jgi:hypothetical protein
VTAPRAPTPDDAIAAADVLHARVRRFIETLDEDYDALVRALAVHQARHSPGYARLCAARGVDPARAPLVALPAVPTDAFKLARVATYPAELDAVVFRTSGTTVGARGAHPMRTLDTYRAAAINFASSTLFGPYRARRVKPRIVALALPVDRAPDSSLVRMMAWFIEVFGAEGSCFAPPDDLDAGIVTIERASAGGAPVVLLGAAFAFVHLLDRLGPRVLALPRGSRAMQTGGFKGRSREVEGGVLRRELARALSIRARDVVGEYGMTELTSQLYAVDDAAEARDDRFIYRAPPWVRVVACDPVTLAQLPFGARGIARIEDLGNVESAWAIQTADLIEVRDDGGVELFGRLPGATPRGCSIAIEELLERRRT